MYYIVISYVISESAQRRGRCSGTFLSWQKSALRRDQNDCCACAKHPSAKLERWKPGGYLPVSHYISFYIIIYHYIVYYMWLYNYIPYMWLYIILYHYIPFYYIINLYKSILPYQFASLRSCHVGQEAALVKLFTPAMVSSCAFQASIIITSYPVQSRTEQEPEHCWSWI